MCDASNGWCNSSCKQSSRSYSNTPSARHIEAKKRYKLSHFGDTIGKSHNLTKKRMAGSWAKELWTIASTIAYQVHIGGVLTIFYNILPYCFSWVFVPRVWDCSSRWAFIFFCKKTDFVFAGEEQSLRHQTRSRCKKKKEGTLPQSQRASPCSPF